MKSTIESGTQNCGNGAFYQAFVANSLTKANETGLDLVGYKQEGSTIVKTRTQDDTYEVFSKGVGLYNGAADHFTKYSWPYILKEKQLPPNDDPATIEDESISNEGKDCFSCMYSINIKNKRFGLPYRTYIWVGKSDTQGNPEWCFAYGEKEWVSGQKDADGNYMDFEKYKRRAKVISKYRVPCN